MSRIGIDIRARYLDDSSLWSWEWVDHASGAVIESSWSRDWMAYRSPDEALQAGRAALTLRTLIADAA